MTATSAGNGRALAAPMTPERWRVVDEILQHAIALEPARRGAFAREACGADEALHAEVTALLAAHDEAPTDFLERPAAQMLGIDPSAIDELHRALLSAARDASAPPPTASAEPVRGRRISAHVAVFAAMAGIIVGVALEWGFAHSSLPTRWNARAVWPWSAPNAAPVVNADVDMNAAVANGLALVVVDRSGALQRTIVANRPWTPRFSPDGRRVAYGAFGSGRGSSDLWITDIESGNTKRVTDDDGDSNDPQWNPSGTELAFSVSAPDGKDVAELPLGSSGGHVVAVRPGVQFPNDWPRDGKALLVTDEAEGTRHDILIQPIDGSPARPYVATMADETAARMSPDGRWVAYTSDESGRPEVYVDSYPIPGRRVMISRDGGMHPVWRGDGRELYYWRDGALVAVQIGKPRDDTAFAVGTQSELFRAPYEAALNTMYDVSPDGQRFVIVERRRD